MVPWPMDEAHARAEQRRLLSRLVLAELCQDLAEPVFRCRASMVGRVPRFGRYSWPVGGGGQPVRSRMSVITGLWSLPAGSPRRRSSTSKWSVTSTWSRR